MRPFSYVIARVLKKLRGAAIANSNIHATSKIGSGSTISDCAFGRHSYCGYDCFFVNCDVGSFCSIAGRVSAGGSRHPMEFVSTSPVFLNHLEGAKRKFARHSYKWQARTLIGNDVWIGEGAFIKAGVKIGHGAVVGMGSVVTKDVSPYAILAGNPARLIRMRFDPEVIEALLRMSWWNLPDDELIRLGPAFSNPRELLAREGFL